MMTWTIAVVRQAVRVTMGIGSAGRGRMNTRGRLTMTAVDITTNSTFKRRRLARRTEVYRNG